MNAAGTVQSIGPPRVARVRDAPWTELTILLGAALVRLWRLEYHSIWFDESISLKWARSDAGYIWQVTFPLIEDKHPPLYYLLLHYWMQVLDVVGLTTSDGALRAFGSILGVLTVAGIMLLASQLSNRATGLLSGALVAVAPLLVWYSQELRMFQPATTAIVWSAAALCLAWASVSMRWRILWWVIFVACLTSALYGYLFSAFMLPAAGLSFLVLAYQKRSLRFLVEGSVALTAVAVAFLPLANNAWMINASESSPGVAFSNFAANTYALLRVFTVWRPLWPTPFVAVVVVAYAALAVAGIVVPIPHTRKDLEIGPLDLDQVWIVIWLLTPFLVANVLLARSASIFSEERYLLFMAPFFLWAVARGVGVVAARSRPIGWAAAVAALAPLALALPVLWTPSTARENWRAAAGYLAAYSRSSSGIPGSVIAHVDYTHEPLEWYLRQDTNFEELPVFFPFGGTLDTKKVGEVIAPPLLGLVDFGAQTVWLTQSHLEGVDDQRLVERWLAEHFPVITEQYPAGIKLSGYMLQYRYPELPALDAHAQYPKAEIAPGVMLAACEIVPQAVAARDEEMHPPSGWVHLRIWWQADKAINDEYVTTAQVVGPEGVWGERLHRSGETMDMWPSTQWVVGEYVREELDINLNPVTPPGKYPVMVGLSTAEGSAIGQPVVCGEVEIR